MIKLTRSPKPTKLTLKLQKTLTREFQATGKTVWNLEFLKEALLSFSNNKCCYCESNINEESKYMEVEHFHDKHSYPSEVIAWENLLPSCKKCNGTKGIHNTYLEPIIDPSKDDPKMHLKFWCYRIKGKNELGKLTISVLDLNNQDRLVIKRFLIGNAIHNKLEHLNELLDEYLNGIQTTTKRKNRIVNGLKEVMREGLPTSVYSATCAATILNDSDYNELKEKLEGENFWDNDFIDLEDSLSKIAFDLAK